MTSPAKIRANRRNACKSTGPRTRAGKATVARNARTHGLNIPAICDGFAGDIVALAREIEVSVTGAEADANGHELACRVAETIIDIGRVRLAKLPLVAALEADPADRRALRQLCRLGRYEARAFVRRRRAIRDFDAVVLPLRAAKQSQRRNPNDIRQCAQTSPLAQPHPEERSQRERVSKDQRRAHRPPYGSMIAGEQGRFQNKANGETPAISASRRHAAPRESCAARYPPYAGTRFPAVRRWRRVTAKE